MGRETVVKEYDMRLSVGGESPHRVIYRVTRIKPEMFICPDGKIMWDITDAVFRAFESGEEARLVK